MEQGEQSLVELKDGKVIKHINEYDVYDEFVEPWREFKILEYVQKLSPYFPQNVFERGAYIVGYDYIPGKRLEQMTDKYWNQIIALSKILAEHGFSHGDDSWDNYIIDENDNIHIIDFGQSNITKLRNKLIVGKILEVEDGNGNIIVKYIPPTESYQDIPISNKRPGYHVPDDNNYDELYHYGFSTL